MSRRFLRAAFGLMLGLSGPLGVTRAAADAGVPASEQPGFVVIAPDRGFLGNEETRDAFAELAASRNAALVFVTDERTRRSLDDALSALAKKGARRVVVLPFFISRSDPRFRRVESLLASTGAGGLPVVWARPYGESYLAVEALAERLREIPQPAGRRIAVVGTGSDDDTSRERMAEDWQRLADQAARGLGFADVHAVVSASSDLRPALQRAVEGGERPTIVPFHLGSKLDGMMSLSAAVRGAAPQGAEVVDGDVTPHATVGLWMAREANRQVPPAAEEVGVVALAHGSDYHWNETMRQALAPLQQRYKLEPAFSMADPVVIERAVRRLEARGARAIVILRIFGLAASFREDVERLIGLDVENTEAAPRAEPAGGHAGHGGHGHAGHASARPAPRIRSSAVITTVGGVEDDPLFAQALLERARSLSREPGKETLILLAHGDGDDARDAHWRELLDSLAARMRASGASRFRAIRTATWREDWPEKRAPAVATVRSYVEQAAIGGGRAIVLPARTLGEGPERRLLEGLAFDLGEGFAPHPLFAQWAEQQVAGAVATIRISAAGSPRASEGAVAATR